jgi:hypothetical protein
MELVSFFLFWEEPRRVYFGAGDGVGALMMRLH